ncbi:MAG: 50S ribosomal protein L7 [Oscillospiraceae bacterium]|nr:50S ribosomal protein L7 [Oscillospiraceae bacterium]
MDNRALNYLALGKKGRLVELGEEPVGAVARAIKARLVIVAADASDHTWRRAKSFVAGTEQQCIRVPFTKEELGFVVGRQSLAIAAFTDAALALAFTKALPNAEKFKDVVDALDTKAQKLRQRKEEAKAHQRNVRKGKK